MNLLKDSSDWLEGMRTKYTTREIVYKRDGVSVALLASVGKTVFSISRDQGGFERYESRDYLILASDLILDGTETLPQRGDLILEDNHVYEVLVPGNEPCFRYSDLYRKSLRIHTKLVGRCPA